MRSTLIFSISLIWLVLSGLLSSPAKATEIFDLNFKQINKRHGLSDSSVLDIVEDRKGYIWIATANGLNRYSGYDVKQYHPSDVNPNSIPSGYVPKLYLDSDGGLWVGTHGGLAKYQPESDNFEVFDSSNSVMKSNFVTGISEASDGDILFTDVQYLYRYSKDIEKVKLVKKFANATSSIEVIRDESNRIWLGSDREGIAILDKASNELFRTDEVNPWGITIDVSSLKAIEAINGNYWLATNEGVLIISASGRTISKLTGESLGQKTQDMSVSSIRKINNDVWIGTNLGLFVIKHASSTSITEQYNPEFIHLSQKNQEITGLPLADIKDIFIDRMDAIWISTIKKGAHRYHPQYAMSRYKSVFNSEKEIDDDYSAIWGFSEDAEGKVFVVSQQRGVGEIQRDTAEVAFFDYFSSIPDTVTYWDIEIDNNGIFWIASSNGLYVLRRIEGKLELINHVFEGQFIDFLYRKENEIWLWSKATGLRQLSVDSVDGDRFALASESIDISSEIERPVPIFKDSAERLWLRSEDNLVIYSVSAKKVIASFNDDNGLNSSVQGIYEQPGVFWITTRANGVVEVDKASLEIKRQQERQEVTGHIISSVGYNKSIWYVDSAGIHEISIPELDEVTTIPNSELNYNSLGESSVFASSNGDIYFGGMQGYNLVSGKRTVRDIATTTSTPEISEFKIFGASESGNNSQITLSNESDSYTSSEQNVTYSNGVFLKYDETRFSVSFYLLNAIYPGQTNYRYRLSGFDDAWTYAGNERTAQFNNIRFGTYTFEVQAKEPKKQWSNSKLFTITVDRPPWLHSVALVFYCIVAMAVFGFIIRQYQLRKANQLAIKESEERLKLTLWSSGDELWDWDVYRGQVYRANTWGTLDFPQDDIRTTGSYDANIHPNDINRVKEALREHLEGKSEFYELAYRAKTFKNQWIWILDRGKVVSRDHNEQPVRMTGTLKNIHHLKEAEEQLNLFKRSIENISEGVFITNTQFKFISVNYAYCTYTGETRDQALASYMHFHLYPDAFTEEIKKTLKAKGNWSGEVESVRVNGERYEMELNIDAVHDEDGKISHFVGVFSDITSRKSTEKELLKLANTDPLTELPNRSFFQASHQNLVRKGAQHTLLCLDMDNFKKINDSLGHQTGDILIKQIAKRLQRITGKSATCYRLGGDEFSILMDDNADIHTVTHYAQSLLDTLSRPFIINKQEFVLGASIGIAFFPDDGTSPQEMLKNADTAMYFAKNNGGNSYQFFSGEMNQNAVRQLQIENLIRQGIKDDLFTVYYQPKVDIASGKLVSMEALVRFEHPQKGIVSPGQFIPLAEQTGQIIEIGEQVLRKACADTKRWVNQGLFSGRVAVNISAKQFELPDLDERINKILNEVGLSPLHLECEITEGTLMESPENGLRMMNRLRERGIHLALDDFGTGYSSLAYLKRFPLNTLKIDKAFIDDIAKSNVDRHMAAAIINIAHNLGLKVVAEGVEEEAQLNILRRYDCEMLQGFLYSRPLNAERFEKLLSENQKLHTLLGQSNF